MACSSKRLAVAQAPLNYPSLLAVAAEDDLERETDGLEVLGEDWRRIPLDFERYEGLETRLGMVRLVADNTGEVELAQLHSYPRMIRHHSQKRRYAGADPAS